MYYFVIDGKKKVKKIQMPGIFLSSSIHFAYKSENVFISIYD